VASASIRSSRCSERASATVRCVCALGCLAAISCAEQPPPGAGESTEAAVIVATPEPSASVGPGRPSEERDPQLGRIDDDLSFAPNGDKIVSIAWRTWIYTDTGPQRTRLGYLRAGAVLDRRGPEIVNDGCTGGWWRINPRGFVCVGKGATLDLAHPVATFASDRPSRGAGLPYAYARSRERAPHLYFKLPGRKEMTDVEGSRWIGDGAALRARAEASGVWDWLGEPAPPPEHMRQAKEFPKPYGVKKPLHFTAHAGQVSPDSGFALHAAIDWEGRLFGFTTEHDLIALDRTTLSKPSSFRGLAFGPEEDVPAAFVTKRWALRYEKAASGQLEPRGTFEFRQGLKLTGQTLRYEGVGFWETADGAWAPVSSITLIDRRDSFPSVATGSRKWIDISIRDQVLVAYEGRKAVYATLVSTGRGGMGDPEKVPATARGTFMIHAKHVTATMDGEEDVADSFELRDVPFVQYFHKGYALHGTYWHDDFGKVRSHGCVNLSGQDAAWLFEWTDPEVPEGWHAAMNLERGTVVNVRY
jgi:lipoprotein-anchoring transpeptidase ErfK/SrfK